MGCGVLKPPWGQAGPYSCLKDKLSVAIRAWVVLKKACQGPFGGLEKASSVSWLGGLVHHTPLGQGRGPSMPAHPTQAGLPSPGGQAIRSFGLFCISVADETP